MPNTMNLEQFDFSHIQAQGGYVQINIFVGKMPPSRVNNYIKKYSANLKLCKLLDEMEIPFDLIPFREFESANIVNNHVTMESDNSGKNETEQLKKSVESLKDLKNVQCSDGNWNHDPYMHGMANGLILASSLFEAGEIEYLDRPDTWIKDKNIPNELTVCAMNELSKEFEV